VEPLTNFHELKTFLTASGLLAAVLAVWLRFWVDLARERQQMTGLMGRVWSFIATLVLLAAMALAIQQNVSKTEGYVPNEAIGLFFAGLAMTGIAVGESAFRALVECYDYVRTGKYGTYGGGNGEGARKAMVASPRTMPGRLLLVLYPLLCAILLIGGFLWFAHDDFSTCSGGMWYLIFPVVPLAILPVPSYLIWDRLSANRRKRTDSEKSSIHQDGGAL
jgi:hypothetical protein